ncbi:EF-hand domain-containing protein [Candidatus Hydrogenedentota bacterium]
MNSDKSHTKVWLAAALVAAGSLAIVATSVGAHPPREGSPQQYQRGGSGGGFSQGNYGGPPQYGSRGGNAGSYGSQMPPRNGGRSGNMSQDGRQSGNRGGFGPPERGSGFGGEYQSGNRGDFGPSEGGSGFGGSRQSGRGEFDRFENTNSSRQPRGQDRMGGPPKPEELFEEIDADKDGMLSREEFIQFHENRRPPMRGGPGSDEGERRDCREMDGGDMPRENHDY